MGFEFDNENFIYTGYYKSYYIVINADTDTYFGDAIVLSALINPAKHQIGVLQELQKWYELKIQAGNYSVARRMYFLFKAPNKEKLTKQLNLLICDLQSSNIKPTEL